MENIRKLHVGWVVFLFILLASGCKSDKNVREFEMNIRLKEDPARMNPLFHLGVVGRLVHQYIFLPLADFHPYHYQLTPILIEAIPEKQLSESGGAYYDIQFKKDAVWDDGSPLTGHDYLFTVKLILHPELNTAAYRGYFDFVDDITINENNPKSFRVHFTRDYMLALESIITIPVLSPSKYDPDGLLNNMSISDLRDPEISKEWLHADPRHDVYVKELNGLKYGRDIVSNCGPYHLLSWETDQNLVIEAKEKFWGLAYPDNPFLQQGPDIMNFYIIPDETTCISQLKEGNLDVVNGISTQRFVELQQNDEYGEAFSYHSPALMRFYFLGMNNTHPFLSDRRVRRAIGHLVDVEQMILNMENGLGERLAVPINPARPYYNSNLNLLSFDPDKALQLLNEAGWVDSDRNGILDKVINGRKQELIIDGYTSQQELGRYVMLMLQENARKIGVKINIITKDFSVIMRDHVRTRDYGITPLVINQDLNDDDLHQRWHSDNDDPAKGNTLSYRNDAADSLIMEIRSVEDKGIRYRLYKELQQVLYDDTPAVFLYTPVETLIISNRWNGNGTVKRPGYMANTFTPSK